MHIQMPRSHTQFVRFHDLLPPDLPLAGLMATTFVLLGDLLVEYDAIGGGPMKDIDVRVSEIFRRLYFFRRSTATLDSAHTLFRRLLGDPTFKEMLGDASANQREIFMKAKKEFDQQREIIATLRNHVGAHVEDDVSRCLSKFSADERALIEFHSEDGLRPHFAADLVVATMISGISAQARLSEFRRMIEQVQKATVGMLHCFASAIEIYNRKYPLFPK